MRTGYICVCECRKVWDVAAAWGLGLLAVHVAQVYGSSGWRGVCWLGVGRLRAMAPAEKEMVLKAFGWGWKGVG